MKTFWRIEQYLEASIQSCDNFLDRLLVLFLLIGLIAGIVNQIIT